TEQEGKSREATIGIYQDYLQLPRAFYRGGFRYTFSVADASHRELRTLGEANITAYQGHHLRLINRTRGELRWVNDEFSWRMRDRIHLQRYAVDEKPPAWAPYATFEAYYDSRYNTIARLGARVGAEARLSRVV